MLSSARTGVLAAVLATSLVSCTAIAVRAAGEGGRCAEALPDIFDRVSPAVVSIAAMSINPYRLAERVTHVVGSGVIFDPAGLILTNSHVVFGRQSITVTLDSGTRVPGELVGADPIFDVAVVRISVPDGTRLRSVPFGDSDRLRVGEDVVTIGNPLGLDQTLTRGVVSAINRILPETPFSLQEPLIQIDAPINPGNSGGPLLNRCGEVVGINTAIMTEAPGIGFAIPTGLVRAMLPALLSQGRIVRPWVGFHGSFIDDGLREVFRLPLVEGLLVEVVEPGSPAQRSGLRGGHVEFSFAGRHLLWKGDIVIGANGVRPNNPERLAELMRTLIVGTVLRLTVFRDGNYREVEFELPERPLLPSDLPDTRLLSPAVRGDVPPRPARRPVPGPDAGGPPSSR